MPRSRRRIARVSRPARALALLVVAALLALATPAHEALEALRAHEAADAEALAAAQAHGSAAERAPRVEAACPGDCHAPGHGHRRHDHASCTACRAFSIAFVHAAPLGISFTLASNRIGTVTPLSPRAPGLRPDAPRGPPATPPVAA